MAVKNVYIHVPFCIKKCAYCDFYSTPCERGMAERYVNALELELDLRGQTGPVETLYIGGGTPTVLDERLLEGLLSVLSRKLELKNGAECTIEANPATLSGRKIAILKKYGINRVSLGVQSFSDRLLSVLGRVHDAREAEEALGMVRSSFENFSIDLIYGIPSQTLPDWEETLRRALAFGPPHISAYELTPETGTPLSRDLGLGRLLMPDEDTILAMFGNASSILRGRGYRHYEISNYGLPGRESRHNINYWRRGEYLGFGPAAHSFLNGKRYANVSDVPGYCRSAESGAAPVAEEISLSREEAIKEFIFLGLRTVEGVDLSDLPGTKDGSAINVSFLRKRLERFCEAGLIEIGEGGLSLTEGGFPLSNALILEVLSALGL